MDKTAEAVPEGMLLRRRVALRSGGWVELQVLVDVDTLSIDDWRWIWDCETALVQYERDRVVEAAEDRKAGPVGGAGCT